MERKLFGEHSDKPVCVCFDQLAVHGDSTMFARRPPVYVLNGLTPPPRSCPMKIVGSRSTKKRSVDERNLLVDTYRDYSDRMVRLLMKKMGLPSEHYDDYQSAAYLGLIDAADRFDSSSPHSFQTYAFYRIRGEVIDHIRRSGHLRGRNYHFAKALAAAESLKETCLSGYGREQFTPCDPNPSENRGGNELAELLDFASKALLTKKLSLSVDGPHALDIPDERPTPEESLGTDQEYQQLREYVAELPELERLVLEAYYFRDISFLEVADEVIGASKSWVSRIHARALKMLEVRYRAEESPQGTVSPRPLSELRSTEPRSTEPRSTERRHSRRSTPPIKRSTTRTRPPE